MFDISFKQHKKFTSELTKVPAQVSCAANSENGGAHEDHAERGRTEIDSIYRKAEGERHIKAGAVSTFYKGTDRLEADIESLAAKIAFWKTHNIYPYLEHIPDDTFLLSTKPLPTLNCCEGVVEPHVTPCIGSVD